ncbi:putative AN1-type zinc finger protein [Cercophora samala]|uniref:AN1-type zinc finger protein n=1 Tax=Cercophora samala TaxID=330535 RepID=A0AA40DGA9_9PEZI|nr:putative AN1-type zinc finger protein [Cercophora samala]
MSSPNPTDTTYISMSPAALDARGTDASLIGSHCQYPPCNQLDFLPFKCQSCSQTYCSDHRTEDGHDCPQKGAWATSRRLAEQSKASLGAHKQVRDRDVLYAKPCAEGACKTTIGTSLVPGVHCTACRRDYCLKHRLEEDHDCKSKPPLGGARATALAAQQAALTNKATSALERLKLWGAAKKEQYKDSRAAKAAGPNGLNSKGQTKMVAVNALKKTAKGDAKIPPEKRVYLYVEAENETAKAKIPKGEFFFSEDWVVGRMLDLAASKLQVQNINNRSDKEEDKLRVFHVEGGRILDFGEKLGAALVSGNTVVILRGVGAPEDLIKV